MGKRHEAREAALQFLFGLDLNADLQVNEESDFWKLRPTAPDVQAFSIELVSGLIENLPEIDQLLDNVTENYELKRIAAVDRNILRMAIFEMLFREDIPPVVSINEAIEIAKDFGTEQSGRFVNGVLDRVKKDLDRPLREPAPAPVPGEEK